MKKHRIPMILFIGVLCFLFYSCKKNEKVNLSADSPVYTHLNTWTLSGSIQSSDKISFQEYGFQFMEGSDMKILLYGPLKKEKKVQVVYPSQYIISDVILFARDKDRNVYESAPSGAHVGIMATHHYSDESGENFVANTLISNMTVYNITEYGIEYPLSGSGALWSKYTAGVGSYSNLYLVNMPVNFNQSLFIPNEKYEYRVYAKYKHLPSTEFDNPVYSAIDTFTASLPS